MRIIDFSNNVAVAEVDCFLAFCCKIGLISPQCDDDSYRIAYRRSAPWRAEKKKLEIK